MSPAEFITIKEKIQQSNILSDQERKEWLFLLPKMTPEQMKELDRILSLKIPSLPRAGEVELRKAEVKVAPKHLPPPPLPKPPPIKKEEIKVPVSPAPQLDFSSVTVEAMRKAPSIYVFLEGVANKMRMQISARRSMLEHIAESFEQSPLYRAYLNQGVQGLSSEKTDVLTQGEFEAIADFRSSMRKM